MYDIHVITPIVTTSLPIGDMLAPLNTSTVTISWSTLDSGPASIEGDFDESLAVPDIIRRAMEAERNGAHAVVINCLGDPGLGAAREAVSIPVFGPAISAMHMATTLGHRYAVISVLRRVHALIRRLATIYGTIGHMTPMRSVDIPVLDIHGNEDELVRQFVREAKAAIDDDEAEVIVLGCTGFTGLDDAIRTALDADGYTGIPVIDPLPAAVRYAEAVLNLGLSHSKAGYPPPGDKPVCGYILPGLTG